MPQIYFQFLLRLKNVIAKRRRKTKNIFCHVKLLVQYKVALDTDLVD